jgi:hypothetical protein
MTAVPVYRIQAALEQTSAEISNRQLNEAARPAQRADGSVCVWKRMIAVTACWW